MGLYEYKENEWQKKDKDSPFSTLSSPNTTLWWTMQCSMSSTLRYEVILKIDGFIPDNGDNCFKLGCDMHFSELYVEH